MKLKTLNAFFYFSSGIFWFFQIFILLIFQIWFYYLKWTNNILVYLHDCAIILELTTIIWSWENCNKLSISEKLVAFLYNLKISILFTWWDRQIRSRLLSSKNFFNTSAPNKWPIPLYLFYLKPFWFYPGSDHNKSHTIPSKGISKGRFIFRRLWKFFNYGPIPPCIQNILSSISAHKGK